MKFFIAPQKGVDFHITFTSKQPCMVESIVYSLDTDVVYNMRRDHVKGFSSVKMKVPCPPANCILEISTDLPNNLQISTNFSDCKSYKVQMTDSDWEFIDFVEQFLSGMNEGTILPSDNVIKSPSGQFKIVLKDRIRNNMGAILNTPCAIGSQTGTIEIDYQLLSTHTFSGQMALICHEYGHFYVNPKMGLPKRSEEGADRFGMCLFLGAGYGQSEYINAFKSTFKVVNTQENKKRIQLMKHFAQEITEGKIFIAPYKL